MLQIIERERVASTNSELKTLAQDQNLQNWTVISALDQTAGRGQAGNTWETQAGKNCICSIFFRPQNIAANKQFILSKAIAIGIVQYLKSHAAVARIKWPNDIYVADKKICGILIENRLIGNTIESCIAGIGLNINQSVFSHGIPNPTSLLLEKKTEYDPRSETESLANFVKKSVNSIEAIGIEAINNTYHNHLYKKDIEHLFKVKNEYFQGIIRSVSDIGEITILDCATQSLRNFFFKEVEYCLRAQLL